MTSHDDHFSDPCYSGPCNSSFPVKWAPNGQLSPLQNMGQHDPKQFPNHTTPPPTDPHGALAPRGVCSSRESSRGVLPWDHSVGVLRGVPEGVLGGVSVGSWAEGISWGYRWHGWNGWNGWSGGLITSEGLSTSLVYLVGELRHRQSTHGAEPRRAKSALFEWPCFERPRH